MLRVGVLKLYLKGPLEIDSQQQLESDMLVHLLEQIVNRYHMGTLFAPYNREIFVLFQMGKGLSPEKRAEDLEHWISLLETNVRLYINGRFVCGLSEEYENLAETRFYYEHAEQAAEQFFYTGDGTVFYYKNTAETCDFEPFSVSGFLEEGWEKEFGRALEKRVESAGKAQMSAAGLKEALIRDMNRLSDQIFSEYRFSEELKKKWTSETPFASAVTTAENSTELETALFECVARFHEEAMQESSRNELRDLFEENGWEIPTTFSEFEELLAEIKETTDIVPLSLCYEAWSLLFIWEPVMSAYDPDYTRGLDDYTSKADGEGASGSLQKLVDWSEAGYFGDNWLGSTSSDDQLLTFTTGNAAMMIGGSWNISSIDQNNPDLNYGAFQIPAEDGTTGLVGTAANGFSINANTENLDAAVAFASYCASVEGQTAWVQAVGGVSASPDIESAHEVAQEITVSGDGNIYRSWQNVVVSYTTDSDAANTIWEEDILSVFGGSMTVDEMMADIAAVME